MNGILIDIIRRDKGVHANVSSTLQIVGLVYLDQIVEVKPIHLLDGDTVYVSWDLNLKGKTNGKTTSVVAENFKHQLEITETQTISYIRLIRKNGVGKVLVYKEMPTDVQEVKE